MNSNYRIYFVIIFAFSCIAGWGNANAQQNIELLSSVPNPSPNQNITITAKSYAFDINAANIVWLADGKILQRGVGITTVNTKAPALGKTLRISIEAVSSEGFEFSNEILITSGSIDMIVEPQGYVPPMYPGKIPVSYQNQIKVVAVPQLADSSGNILDPKNLIYKWEQNGNVLQNQSGYGRQSITIFADVIPRPIEIVLTVTSRDGTSGTKSLLIINQSSPVINFYENDPTYGPLYNNAIPSTIYLRQRREVGVLAVPFGFNIKADNIGNLITTWLINGRELTDLSSNLAITLRAPEGTSGNSNINLKITNKESILQSAENSFIASFTTGNNRVNTNF